MAGANHGASNHLGLVAIVCALAAAPTGIALAKSERPEGDAQRYLTRTATIADTNDVVATDSSSDAASAETESSPDPIADLIDKAASETEPVDTSKIDWSALVEASVWNRDPVKTLKSTQPIHYSEPRTSWSRNVHDDGSAAVAVKRAVPLPLDASVGVKIGADFNLNESRTSFGDPIESGTIPFAAPPASNSVAWASISAPGPAGLWDSSVAQARLDPTKDEKQFITSLTKSVPLDHGLSLTLRNGYSVTQPLMSGGAAPAQTYTIDNSARLRLVGEGTSFIVGQNFSSADDRWLNKIGAEQKLFDSVTVNGTISETATGGTGKSIGAAFKRSW